MATKPHTAYIVVESSGTYGVATPYAVVSTGSGMPHMPAHGRKEAAQEMADRLNAEEQRETERLKAVAQRTADGLRDAVETHDDG